MFSIHCPRHGSEVLLFANAIRGMRNTLHGIEIDWICSCGQTGTLVTGRLAEPQPA